MSDRPAAGLKRLSRASLSLLVLLIFAALAATVVSLPPVAAGLSEDVNAALARSGAGNPVTATLLDFRSYDTLLEIAVLLLVVIAIRGLRRGDLPQMRPDDEILVLFGRVLFPVMILTAGYLLVAGLDAAGGAFQAGAILAAAGVLLILAGWIPPLRDDGLSIRVGLGAGLAVFVAVGIAGALFGTAFLDHPQRQAGAVVLLLEIGATLSVALALIDLFLGVLRRSHAGRTNGATTPEQR